MSVIFILAICYLGFGILLSLYDVKQTDKELEWDTKEAWLGFLKWPTRFLRK